MVQHNTIDHTGLTGVGASLATDTLWQAAGDLVQGTGADTAAVLTAGTAGHVLTSNGAAAALSWQAAGGSGGGLVLLEQHTASASASLDFTTCISATYDDYLIRLVNVRPATDNVTLYMRMSTDGGSTYVASAGAYTNATFRFHSGAAGANSGGTATHIVVCGLDLVDNSTNPGGVTGELSLFNPEGAFYKRVQGMVGHIDQTAAALETAMVSGWYPQTTAVDAFQFLFSSGNIAAGTIRVYGLAK